MIIILLFEVYIGVLIGIVKFVLLCGVMCLVIGCRCFGLKFDEICYLLFIG